MKQVDALRVLYVFLPTSFSSITSAVWNKGRMIADSFLMITHLLEHTRREKQPICLGRALRLVLFSVMRLTSYRADPAEAYMSRQLDVQLP